MRRVIKKKIEPEWVYLSEALTTLSKARFGKVWSGNRFVKECVRPFYPKKDEGKWWKRTRHIEIEKGGRATISPKRLSHLSTGDKKLAISYRDLCHDSYFLLLKEAKRNGGDPVRIRVPGAESDIPLRETKEIFWTAVIHTIICTGYFPIKRARKSLEGQYGAVIISREWITSLALSEENQRNAKRPRLTNKNGSLHAAEVKDGRPNIKGRLIEEALTALYGNTIPGKPARVLKIEIEKWLKEKDKWRPFDLPEEQMCVSFKGIGTELKKRLHKQPAHSATKSAK